MSDRPAEAASEHPSGPRQQPGQSPLAGPGDSDSGLLRAWEDRIDSAGDPLGALADLLGERQATRNGLFQRAGSVVRGVTLESILGAGGMGVTYAGRDAADTRVAVKLVHSVASDGGVRFDQECRLLRQLDHPAIVRYRDHVVLEDGTGVLVMDHVDGIDLDRLLADVHDNHGPTTVVGQALCHELPQGRGPRLASPRFRRRILRLLATIADGLHAAHERGIVHRDVKPANVLVRCDLEPVLIDFGLARDQQLKVSFTASGAAMGTLAYMAPEQLGRDPGAIDRRTDVYALGLVLHRALLGDERRYDVQDVVIASQRPFLLHARHSRVLPVTLQAILYRCLDVRPASRYPTAAVLAADLRAAAANEPIAARRPGWLARSFRDRRRIAAGLGSLVTAILVGLLIAWPRGRWVVLSANVHPHECWIEVAGKRVRSGASLWLPYGAHRTDLIGQTVRERSTEIRVEPGIGAQLVGLLTQRRGAVDPSFYLTGVSPVHFTTGHSWTPMAPGIAVDARWINGASVTDPVPIVAEGMLPPGLHHFRAVDGKGREEGQSLVLGEEPADVQLLPAILADVDGAFRCTWSTVFTPLPPALRLTSTAERWLADAETVEIGGAGTVAARCAYVPGAEGVTTEVELTCTFPQPMRSAVVALRGQAEIGSQIHVVAGFAGGALAAWPHDENGELQPRQAFRSETGATAFVVRAQMRANSQMTNSFAPARFLSGKVFGGHWRDEPPCFAIAADPDAAAVLPQVPQLPPPHKAPSVSVLRFLPVPAHSAVSLSTWARGEHGSEIVFCARREPRTAAELIRRSWPDFKPLGSVPASILHARRGGIDGMAFGENVVALPDDDGDGYPEWCVGDVSSQDSGTMGGGIVARIDSGEGTVRWRWAPRSTSDYGDDHVGAPLSAGDWNADAYPDVIASADYAWSGGVPKSGRISVLDGRTGSELWTLVGTKAMGKLSIGDCHHTQDGGDRSTLLLQEWAEDERNQIRGMWLSTWTGGVHGRRSRELLLPRETASVLIAAGDAATALLVLRAGSTADGFVGIERFELAGDTWDLALRQPLAIPHPAQQWLPKHSAVRTGDLDGDGGEDAAFVLRAPGSRGVLFVCGHTLRLLGWCDLEDWVLDLHSRPMWIPAVEKAPAQLLLVATREGEMGFVTIDPWQ